MLVVADDLNATELEVLARARGLGVAARGLAPWQSTRVDAIQITARRGAVTAGRCSARWSAT